MEKIPEGQVLMPRLEPTAPIRLADRKSRALSLTPYCAPSEQKMAQGRTSSTHDSIHTGVIGRCLHVHLTHRIHGVADVFSRSRSATSETVEAQNPWRQTREIINPEEEES